MPPRIDDLDGIAEREEKSEKWLTGPRANVKRIRLSERQSRCKSFPVKYHLRHIYAQLGVSGRATLRAMLASTPEIFAGL